MNCVDKVQRAIERASSSAWLSPDILAIDGMSSPKVRHLLNAICAEKPTRYLADYIISAGDPGQFGPAAAF